MFILYEERALPPGAGRKRRRGVLRRQSTRSGCRDAKKKKDEKFRPFFWGKSIVSARLRKCACVAKAENQLVDFNSSHISFTRVSALVSPSSFTVEKKVITSHLSKMLFLGYRIWLRRARLAPSTPGKK